MFDKMQYMSFCNTDDEDMGSHSIAFAFCMLYSIDMPTLCVVFIASP